MNQSSASGRSVQHDTIVVERTFNASPARVFAAWADSAARARWSSPGKDWELADDSDDFRVGGHEVSRLGPPGDPRFRAETNYLDIVADQRIVMAGTMAERETRISASLATVELLPEGDGTLMIYTEQAAFLDGRDVPENRIRGWGEILDKLEVELRRDKEPDVA